MKALLFVGILAFQILWPVKVTASLAYSDYIKMILSRHDLGRSILLE